MVASSGGFGAVGARDLIHRYRFYVVALTGRRCFVRLVVACREAFLGAF